MPINPWIITWDISNPANHVPANLIAAILPNRTSVADVCRIMQLLYQNEGGYISEQLRFAKGKCPWKIMNYGPSQRYHLGSSPALFGRHAIDFQLNQEDEGDEVATWQDRDFIVKEGKISHVVTRTWSYRKSAAKIVCERVETEVFTGPIAWKRKRPNKNRD